MIAEDLPRLDELTKEELFEFGQKNLPRLTREVFEQMWAEFVEDRKRRQLN